ncbi:universal stress protein [Helicobacter ailurogastricus]|uniref:Putative n=1 Tax=Helicobacter ailurogastricus TaxID=1578720 RepID=A0A0K2Y2Z2_9HELI|nr:universal stress protein [Helicobacter ailurogastricus]CRF40699.1 putative [Helicobacter ailurogastricus]CRF43092.1 putative [Helicobacter ailurogastricus]CRF44321.1 putative [Helicobacter ailurogastricus]CRF52209.1 putative [Helicobacter ailurogastricus]BDQ29330.1 universal stress protein [Helicobacter ailurogastricus]
MLRVLFGISDTQECRSGVDAAIRLFSKIKEVHFTLVHVSPEVLIYPESGIMNYSQTEVVANEQSKQLIDEFMELFTQEGISCETVLKMGNPVDIVLEMAPSFDLLVIGASESSMFYRLFGSHQNSFIDNSPIPVLVAK